MKTIQPFHIVTLFFVVLMAGTPARATDVDLGAVGGGRLKIEGLVAPQNWTFKIPSQKPSESYLVIFADQQAGEQVWFDRRKKAADRAKIGCMLSIDAKKHEALLNETTAAEADSTSGQTNCAMILQVTSSNSYVVFVEGRDVPLPFKIEVPSVGAAVLKATPDSNVSGRFLQPSVLPDWVKPASIFYFLHDGRFKSGKIQGVAPAKQFPDKEWAVLSADLAPKDATVNLYLTDEFDKLRLVSLTKATPTITTPEPPAFNFDESCAEELEKFRKTLTEEAWSYYLCADLTQFPSARYKLQTTHDDKDRQASSGHVFGGRRIAVRAWHKKAVEVDLSMGGTAGRPSPTYGADDRDKVQSMATTSADDVTSYHEVFSGRTEPFFDLTLTIKNGNSSWNYTFPFEMERQFTGALRLGVAATWGPWDRLYDIRKTGGDAPGSVIAIKSGESPMGLPSLELSVGYSLFFHLVNEHDGGIHPAWYFGAGLLKVDAKGADALSSLLTGFELGIGQQFSLVLLTGLRRTEWLQDGYRVGSALPADISTPPTTFGVTPVFGIVLNYSPSFWGFVEKYAKK